MIQRRGGRRTDPHAATPEQRRKLRRQFGRYVRNVQAGGDAFSRPLDAVAYALARWMLSDRGRLPRSKREAHDWIGTLNDDEDVKQVATGDLWIFDLARRPGDVFSAWRVAALRPLATLYGYPTEGWLGRLNAAISERYEAVEDADKRERLKRLSWAYRANVVDPSIRLPEWDGENDKERRDND